MTVLGRYKEIYNNNDYPSIFDDINKPSEYCDKITEYMKHCTVTSVSPAKVKDVISGKPINIELSCMNDGLYAWRTDYIYYIEKYGLKLPDDFVQHFFDKTRKKHQ